MEQKYGNAPGLLKVKENFSSVSRTLDLKDFASSVLTTVWGISSRLLHVTVVPTATVRVGGVKLKLSIFTSAGALSCMLMAKPLRPSTVATNPLASTAARIATDTLLLIVFLPPLICE